MIEGKRRVVASLILFFSENGMGKKDIVLIIVILVLAGILGLFIKCRGTGNQVRITVNGEDYGIYPLNTEQEIVVDNEYGYNKIQIRDGWALMETADCPDKYCVHQGKTKSKGKSIVCLPHKLVVEIIGGDENEDIDAIAQ